MTRNLATLGEALVDAVHNAEAHGRCVELPALDKTMALCMIRTHRKQGKNGMLTTSARARVTGDIIVGPYVTREDQPNAANLSKLLRAHRWVLNQVVMGSGKPNRDGVVKYQRGVIAGHPSICPVNRIRTVCKACGHTADEWKDEILIRSKELAVNGIVTHWHPDLDTPCAKCKCHPIAQTKLHTTALDSRTGHYDDPVIDASQRDQVIATLTDAWKAGPPADGQPTLMLPRLWAVYALANVPPAQWEPEDDRARNLVQRAAEFKARVVSGSEFVMEPEPLGILPYGIARKYHAGPVPISDAVKEFWLESDDVSIGWISTKELEGGGDIGYRREFWMEGRQREEGRRRDNVTRGKRVDYIV